MKIKILGTAAAEAWPGLFCNCETCKKVRKLGGKDIRSRASVIFDGVLLIDGGYDNFMHSLYDNVYFPDIKTVFFTHEHSDHFTPTDFRCFFYNEKSLYGSEKVIKDMKDYAEIPPIYEGINVIKPFETVTTADGHTVTSLKAEHNPDQTDQMNYIVEYEGKTVAYLTDSGLYEDQKTWDFIGRFKFDCVISECTSGWNPEPPFYHQTFEGVKKAREILKNMGCITQDTPYYLTHFSHNVKLLHSEICERAEPFGFIVCYDGMDIEI